MTTLTAFTPAARDVLVRAATEAANASRDVLGPEYLLLALADGMPLAGRAGGIGISPDAIRAAVTRPGGPVRRSDRDLLSALGIDADEVRARAALATGVRADDPALWSLRRSRLRPLRVTLTGPASRLPLNEGGRKVIEVALWVRRRAHRVMADREDLLWGLLADYSSPAVTILRRLAGDTDISALWADLQRWNASAP